MPTTNKTISKNGNGIQVIARAACILRTLENESDGLSPRQIAERVNLPRSTVQRIVNALIEEYLLIGASANGKVKLGPAILRMAANTNFDFVRHVRSHLEALAKRTGETVDLSQWQGKKMVFLDQIAGKKRLNAISGVGESFPVHCTAHGKAALSFLSNKEIEKLCGAGLKRNTQKTVTAIPELCKEIEKSRKTHISLDDEEHTEGVCALGTAFRDPLGRIFAVSVPVPSIRFPASRKSISQALLDLRRAVLDSLMIE